MPFAESLVGRSPSCTSRRSRSRSAGSSRRGSPACASRSRRARRTCRSRSSRPPTRPARRRHVLHRAHRQRLPARCRRRTRRRAAPRRREPDHEHRDDAQRPARHVLAGRQDQPRAHARAGRAAWRTRSASSIGVPVAYAVSVDFAGFEGLVDGMGGVQINVPVAMNDRVLRRGLRRRRAAPQRRPGARVLAQPSRLPEQRHHAHRQPGPADPRRAAHSCRRRRREPSASSRRRRCSAATPQLDGLGAQRRLPARPHRAAHRPGRGPQRDDPDRRRRGCLGARRRRRRPLRRLRGRRHAPVALTIDPARCADAVARTLDVSSHLGR